MRQRTVPADREENDPGEERGSAPRSRAAVALSAHEGARGRIASANGGG